MIRILSRYSTLLLSIMAVLAYLTIYYGVGYDNSKYIVDALSLGVGFVITASWSTAAINAMLNGGQSGANKIVLAIWGSWTVLVIQRIFVVISSILGKPDWLTYGPEPGIITTLIIVAGMYVVIAPAQDSDAPHNEITWMIFTALLGGILAGAAIGIFIAQHLLGVPT